MLDIPTAPSPEALPSPAGFSPTIIPLLPPNPPQNSRNSEGDFALLKNGEILFAYSHFTGACHFDHEPAFLAGRTSRDGGLTWSESDSIVLPNEGRMNIMSATFLRLSRGELALFYNRKDSVADCRQRMRVSTDEGRTWGDARLCIPEPGYYPVNNDRVVRLADGRLIIPSGRHEVIIDRFGEPGVGDLSVAMAFYSDDEGLTWKRSATVLRAPGESVSGLQEPGIIELKDGRLMMWMRTDLGCQYQSFSDDGGETWSAAQPSGIISPLSPASLKRLPQTGDLLMIWNDHRRIDQRRRGKRTPLCAAISRDEGATWLDSRIIEDRHLDGYYCYTAIEFLRDRVLLSYCAGDQAEDASGLDLTSIAHFDYRWLYQRTGLSA